jgi:hypothetical protein
MQNHEQYYSHCGRKGHVQTKCWNLYSCNICAFTDHDNYTYWQKQMSKPHIQCPSSHNYFSYFKKPSSPKNKMPKFYDIPWREKGSYETMLHPF